MNPKQGVVTTWKEQKAIDVVEGDGGTGQQLDTDVASHPRAAVLTVGSGRPWLPCAYQLYIFSKTYLQVVSFPNVQIAHICRYTQAPLCGRIAGNTQTREQGLGVIYFERWSPALTFHILRVGDQVRTY